MLIKEYRIPLPLTVEEYKIAQLYMIAKKSRQESKAAEPGAERSGVEILVNEPYSGGPGGEGQFTHKVYHIGSHLPGWFKSLLPKSALTVEEKAWNAYPYTKTQFSCPFVEKFSLEIETYYTPDGGHLENVFSLSEAEMRNRTVDHIDVVRDQDQSYVAEEDLTIYKSEKTGRGPLDQDWVKTYSEECVGQEMPTKSGKSIMCAYKLCKVEFRYWGMQSKIERFIHDMALRNTMLRAHRQAWVWQDEWFGLTMDDIRNIERETAAMLARTMRPEGQEEDEGGAEGDQTAHAGPNSDAILSKENSIGANFSSIEYSSTEAPNIIPKGSEMLHRRSIPRVEDDSRKSSGVELSKQSSRRRGLSERSGRVSQESSPIESIVRDYEAGESDDEFYDCRETADELRSLHRWNSVELVPDTDGETCESAPIGENRQYFNHVELRRAVSCQNPPARAGKRHPTIELCGIRDSVENSCSTTILILVVHGGSVLDPATELAVRKSDVTTLRGAFESIMRQHYPAMVGHVVIKCVACPNVCSDTLAILSNLSPYSFENNGGFSNDRISLGGISLFATASPRYQDYVSQTIHNANKVFKDFLASEEGQGFNGQVCLIGDSIGAILAYDALCRNMRRSASDTSVNEDDRDISPPSPRNAFKTELPRNLGEHFNQYNNNRLSTNSSGSRLSHEDSSREVFMFDVAEFFIFGSPIGILLAYRKVSSTRENQGSQSVIPRPNCIQVYNLFHPSNPVAARLEPLLSAHFPGIPPVNIPRYQKYPMGDGQSLSILELMQSNPAVFRDNSRPPNTPGRIRRCSNDSTVSGIFDTQQMQAMSIMKSKWWGTKRVDYALYCPEGLTNFPTNSLPHLFHASYWESPDVISFILRQILQQVNSYFQSLQKGG